MIVSCILCLLIGLAVGVLAPFPTGSSSEDKPGTIVQPPTGGTADGSSASSASSSQPALDTTSNFNLLGTASYAVQCMKDENWKALAALVDPERGVTFTPYSTVMPDVDRTLTASEVEKIGTDAAVVPWGFLDGSGEPIQMTAKQYMADHVFDVDYTRAPMIGVDRIVMSGNALENLTDVYVGCRFVDYTYPGTDGTDWSSLRLVFTPGEYDWYLVGVIHSQWTV